LHLLVCLLTLILCRYQITVLELIVQKSFERQNIKWSHQIHEVKECQIFGINAPNGHNLSEDTEYASQAALWGIEVSLITLLGL